MKFEWQRFVLDQPLPHVTKLVALTLSVYASIDGGACHPGVERLASDVGLSTRRLPAHLAELRSRGLVELVSRGGGRGRRLADEYRLVVPEGGKQRTPERPVNETDSTDAQASLVTTDTTDTQTSLVTVNTTDVSSNTTDVRAHLRRTPRRPPTNQDQSRNHQGDETTFRGQRLPEPFEVTDGMRRWAHQQGYDDNAIAVITDGFRDYWRSVVGVKGRKADWPATWRNWLRRDRTAPRSGDGFIGVGGVLYDEAMG